MKISITGCHGDIGGAYLKHAVTTNQINALVRANALLRIKNKHEKIAHYHYDKSNVYERAFVKSFTRSNAIVHFAALLVTKEYTFLEYMTTNAMLTGMLAQFSTQHKTPSKFVFISSELVYRLPNEKMVKELAEAFVNFCQKHFSDQQTDLFDLQKLAKQFMTENKHFPFASYNAYALTKYLGEAVVLTLPNAAILRITNAYGPGYNNSRLIPKLIVNRLTGHAVTYIKEQRDFVYIADIHAVFDEVVSTDIRGIIDCKSEEIIDTDDLKERIIHLTPTAYGSLRKVAGNKKNIPPNPIPTAKQSLLSILGKATPFQNGLIKTLRYHKEMCYHQMSDLQKITDFILPGETLIGNLHGSSAAYLFVVESSSGKKVRKVAIRDGVEGNGVAKVKNEIRYYQFIAQNHKKLAKLYPKLIDAQIDRTFSSETIEYLDGFNFYEELQKGKLPIQTYEKSVEKFIDRLSKSAFDTCKPSKDDKNALDVYYLERSLDRLQPIKDLIKIKDSIIINGKELIAPHIILSDLLENKKLRPFITPQVKGFCFHGDMTMLNTVFSKDNHEIRLIDPRGHIGMWDPLYDFAKFKMTLDGFGELIVGAKPIIKKSKDEFIIDFNQIPQKVKYLNEKFFTLLSGSNKFAEKIITYEPYWKQRITFGAATHFLADIPFRLYTDSVNWTALASYVVGTYYLNAEYNTLKNS